MKLNDLEDLMIPEGKYKAALEDIKVRLSYGMVVQIVQGSYLDLVDLALEEMKKEKS
jgi:hypothetical protein